MSEYPVIPVEDVSGPPDDEEKATQQYSSATDEKRLVGHIIFKIKKMSFHGVVQNIKKNLLKRQNGNVLR